MRISILFCVIFLLNHYLEANTCSVHNDIMKSILMQERHTIKNIGYEYLISFNNSCEAKKYREVYENLFLDPRTIDCKNLTTCVNILKNLLNNGVTNLDLGPFQLNYIHQKVPNEKYYFTFINSYYKACSYVESNIKQFGYTWYAIAAYHSRTPELNEIYRKKLIAHYKKLQIMNNSK